MDLNQPLKVGWDIFEPLGALNPALPIVMVTEKKTELEPIVAARVGTRLEKPFSLRALIQTIHLLLSQPTQTHLETIGKADPSRTICARPEGPQANQRHPGEPDKKPQGSKRMKQKVLLVDDDNESLLRSLRHLLSSETYEVVLAENVQAAIAKSEAGEINLLLMNLDSLTEGGWEAIYEITKGNPFLPVIVITSQAELRNLAEAAGTCAFMEKPVDVPMLLQTTRVAGGTASEAHGASLQSHQRFSACVFEQRRCSRPAAPPLCGSVPLPGLASVSLGINE